MGTFYLWWFVLRVYIVTCRLWRFVLGMHRDVTSVVVFLSVYSDKPSLGFCFLYL